MSLDPEIKGYIQSEIKRCLNIVLSGVAGEGDGLTETIDKLFPGADGQVNRPKASPYGFCSIAAKGTISVVVRQGDDNGNRMTILHRDYNAPIKGMVEGEAKMYSKQGYQLYTAKNGIFCGKGSADKPLVLGIALNTMLSQLIDLLVAHVHPSPGSPSDKSTDFLQIKTDTLTPKKLLTTSDGGLP